jgi:hypothetical protein
LSRAAAREREVFESRGRAHGLPPQAADSSEVASVTEGDGTGDEGERQAERVIDAEQQLVRGAMIIFYQRRTAMAKTTATAT